MNLSTAEARSSPPAPCVLIIATDDPSAPMTTAIAMPKFSLVLRAARRSSGSGGGDDRGGPGVGRIMSSSASGRLRYRLTPRAGSATLRAVRVGAPLVRGKGDDSHPAR